jgi:uncharacterized protein YeaO (DUF488 family)
MTVFLRRVRTVGIRITDHEYTAWSEYCHSNHVRSIGELARQAVHEFIEPITEETEKERERHVKRLKKKVKELTAKTASLEAVQKHSAEEGNSSK